MESSKEGQGQQSERAAVPDANTRQEQTREKEETKAKQGKQWMIPDDNMGETRWIQGLASTATDERSKVGMRLGVARRNCDTGGCLLFST